MTEPWELIPAELVAIHGAPGGTSLRALAVILQRHEQIVRAEISEQIRSTAHPCHETDDAYCACADLQRKQAAAIAEGEALAADGYGDEEQRETVAALWPLQLDAIAAREQQHDAHYEFDVTVDDRIRPGMLVMTSANVGALDLETGEIAIVERDDDDQRYADAVNAPLSDATIAALNQELSSGDYARYKRRRPDETRGDSDA